MLRAVCCSGMIRPCVDGGINCGVVVIYSEVVMKIVSSLKSRKNGKGSCLVRRGRRIYVVNKKNPKRKARQGG